MVRRLKTAETEAEAEKAPGPGMDRGARDVATVAAGSHRLPD